MLVVEANKIIDKSYFFFFQKNYTTKNLRAASSQASYKY